MAGERGSSVCTCSGRASLLKGLCLASSSSLRRRGVLTSVPRFSEVVPLLWHKAVDFPGC